MEPALSNKIAALRRLGAAALAHSDGDLLQHLIGTYRLLRQWGCSQALCDAGLFHSVYGTEAFPARLLALDDREPVRAELGDQAEQLVYLFCTLKRDDLYHRMVVDRASGRQLRVPESVMDDLVHLLAANWLEQAARRKSLQPRQFRLLYPHLREQARTALDLMPPAAYQHLNLRISSGPLGATVADLDLANLTDDTFAELYAAWLEHLVLFCVDLHAGAADLVALAQRFGDIYPHPYMGRLRDYPAIAPVIKEPLNEQNFGPGWHTDSPYLERPPKATLLASVEVPEHGGDTLFANMYSAYDQLFGPIKELAHSIYGSYSAAGSYQHYASANHGMELAREADDAASHPVVQLHPESGRHCMYLSPSHVHAFHSTMLTDDSLKLVAAMLCEHVTRDELVYRHQWSAGTVAIWDNRCVLHRALNDYQGQRREMHRIVIR